MPASVFLCGERHLGASRNIRITLGGAAAWCCRDDLPRALGALHCSASWLQAALSRVGWKRRAGRCRLRGSEGPNIRESESLTMTLNFMQLGRCTLYASVAASRDFLFTLALEKRRPRLILNATMAGTILGKRNRASDSQTGELSPRRPECHCSSDCY